GDRVDSDRVPERVADRDHERVGVGERVGSGEGEARLIQPRPHPLTLPLPFPSPYPFTGPAACTASLTPSSNRLKFSRNMPASFAAASSYAAESFQVERGSRTLSGTPGTLVGMCRPNTGS